MNRSSMVRPSIGVDVLELHELDRLTTRAWFMRFGYSPGERRRAAALSEERRREFLAGRFAAKEAILKALGIGMLQGLSLSDIDIDRAENGAPRVCFLGGVSDEGAPVIDVSISHKKEIVVAVALAHCVQGSVEKPRRRTES